MGSGHYEMDSCATIDDVINMAVSRSTDVYLREHKKSDGSVDIYVGDTGVVVEVSPQDSRGVRGYCVMYKVPFTNSLMVVFKGGKEPNLDMAKGKGIDSAKMFIRNLAARSLAAVAMADVADGIDLSDRFVPDMSEMFEVYSIGPGIKVNTAEAVEERGDAFRDIRGRWFSKGGSHSWHRSKKNAYIAELDRLSKEVDRIKNADIQISWDEANLRRLNRDIYWIKCVIDEYENGDDSVDD